jgi:uncharacterized protein (DUF697 family)
MYPQEDIQDELDGRAFKPAGLSENEKDREVRKVRCDLVISNHVATSLGAGFIPVPFVDFLTVSGVQVDLLYRLCKIYDIKFSKQAARSVITSLVGATIPGVSATFLSSALKLVPGVGTIAGWCVMPAMAGATTYAVGKVFVEHLESGGTLLTFDSRKMRAHFESAMAEGKRVVAKVKRSDAVREPIEQV